jgi:hypothetical protein
MRGIITVVLMFVATVVMAADNSTFEFKFSSDSQGKHIQSDVRQMTYIGEAPKWTLSATWEPWVGNAAIRVMHSTTQFRHAEQTDINAIAFQRIYTYGFIDCRLNQLFILNEYYTTQQDLVVLDNKFQPGEYTVDLEANKILHTLLLYVCKSEST